VRPFHVKRKHFIQTPVRLLIGQAILVGGALLLFAAFPRFVGTAAYQVLVGAAALIALWWGLR